VQQASGAKAIMTAHHQDDVVETAVLNFMRGTGRRGLTSLKSTNDIVRPLLEYDKQRIYEYAENHKLAWREDSTNSDTKYLRNYVRKHIVPKLSASQRAQLIILLDELQSKNQQIDDQLLLLLHTQPGTHQLSRKWFIGLPHDVAREVVHTWLRHRGVLHIDRKMIERLVVAMKTAKPGKTIDIDRHLQLKITKHSLELHRRMAAPKHRANTPKKAKS
jgi:hypothetical protein